MFIDYVKIKVVSGKGGDGAGTFRREKFVPKGGPDGGDGGRGGHVYITADKNLSTLVDFRYSHMFSAENGTKGSGSLCHGRMGSDLYIKVPEGTVIRDAGSNAVIRDLVNAGDMVRAAKGGRGGRGNNHFKSATRQAPTFHEKGEPGEEKEIVLELKIIADVGIIGLANAGKSTLISGISNAHPKIAEYPFTTLTPVLGIVRYSDVFNFVVADIPGLIEGASKGAGLGFEFLRHIERTKLYIHMIDGSRGPEQSLSDYRSVNKELKAYKEKLTKKKQIIVINKTDLLKQEEIKAIENKFKAIRKKIYFVSAKEKIGLQNVVHAVYNILVKMPKAVEVEPTEFVERIENVSRLETVDKGIYRLKNRRIEKYVAMLDFNNFETLDVFMKFLDRSGINAFLKAKGVKEGDIVVIGEKDFVFQEDEHA